MTRFACVHGLANARATVIAPRWQTWLRAGGVDAECFDVRWYSTGDFAGDVAEFTADSIRRVFGSPTFRADALAEVSVRIRELLRDPTTVILAHSMGTALVLNVLRELAADGIPPPRTVFFGTPLGHPVHAAWLRALGFDGTPPVRVLSLWNADDPIVCPPDIDPVFPHWMDGVRISVPDHCVPRGTWEHDASLYLTHPVVVEELRRFS